jgi:putative nucleotidyltransferase with HDIG domain
MDALKELLLAAGIAEKHHASIKQYLEVLKYAHEPTFHHVLRVGCIASRMAEYADIPGVTPKMMMWTGLLHDIGKATVPVELLTKTAKFDEADYAAIEPHVMAGFNLLTKVHDYTAHVIVRHHRFGKRPYPEILPPLPDHLESKQETVEAAARLLALADFYDALTTRENEHSRGFTGAQKRELFYWEHASQEALIHKLEDAGVLRF